MIIIRKLRFSTFTERSTTQLKSIANTTEKKIKGTFLEKWVKYWKLVTRDYIDVAISVKQEMRQRPLKSTFQVMGMSTVAYMMTHNPNKQSFRAKYLECSNELSMVSTNAANPSAMEHLKYVEQCYNGNLLRHNSFGLFSIIWVDNFSAECDTYESNCNYLQVQYRKFANNIIDFGFLNIWWVISRKMLDYDVNY